MKKKVKYFQLLCAVFCWNVLAAESGFKAVLEPASVMEGEPFMLRLSTNGNETPELQELPKGFVYQGSSQSTQIVNNYQTSSVGYQFAAPAVGKHKIPPLKVKLGKKTLQTPELALEVVKDTTADLGVEDVFANLQLEEQRKEFFVGEEIPFKINVFYPLQLRMNLTYPDLNIGKSIFRDYRKINPENPSFAPPSQNRRIVDGKLLEEISFASAFRPLAPSITGMAIKKENSAATVREVPSRVAPRMVEPEREVPGIRDRHWKAPMSNAVL